MGAGRDRAEARALCHKGTKSRFLGPTCKSLKVGFPDSGFGLGFPREVFPRQAKLKCSLTYTPTMPVYLNSSSLEARLLQLASLTIPRTAKCPELLCPSRALLMMGWRPAPPRRALPFFLAPTSSCAKPVPSSGIRVSTLISQGPCRLLRAPGFLKEPYVSQFHGSPGDAILPTGKCTPEGVGTTDHLDAPKP